MWTWFKALSMRRKTLLFVGGAMLALAFDALVALFGRVSVGGVRWTEALSVVYGGAACAAVVGAAIWPVRAAMTIVKLHRLVQAVGATGILVGAAGVGTNARAVFDSMRGQSVTFENLARSLTAGPSLTVPAAFTALGVLLLMLRRITRSVSIRAAAGPARPLTTRQGHAAPLWFAGRTAPRERATVTRSAAR